MKCPWCNALSQEIFDKLSKTNYGYWLFTEIWVMLHDGKDYCDYDKK